MGYLLKMYVIAFGVFFIIDMFWLGVIARSFYRNQLGSMMRTDINWMAAVSFYLLFIAGILFFVLQPALAKDSLQYAVFVGAFFGLITYATYDLTNLATLKNWPLTMTLVDLVWGSVLASSTAAVSFLIVKRLG